MPGEVLLFKEVEMRRTVFCLVILMAVAPVAMGQAITSFVGGTEYDSYYGSASGDVVGYRFTVSAPLEIAMLGVHVDTTTPGIQSPHQVGIWDGSQALLRSTTVDGTGTVIGDWMYAPISVVTLVPGQNYTIGALYFSADNDWYISGASSVTTDPNVTWINAVYPTAAELGFAYPGLDSSPSSVGRFGPNFTFVVVPVELQSFSVE